MHKGTYPLKNDELGADFNESLLTATALTAAAHAGDYHARYSALTPTLCMISKKINTLLKKSKANEPERRARLQSAYGHILLILGEREGGTERLEESR